MYACVHSIFSRLTRATEHLAGVRFQALRFRTGALRGRPPGVRKLTWRRVCAPTHSPRGSRGVDSPSGSLAMPASWHADGRFPGVIVISTCKRWFPHLPVFRIGALAHGTASTGHPANRRLEPELHVWEGEGGNLAPRNAILPTSRPVRVSPAGDASRIRGTRAIRSGSRQ